MSEWIEKIIAYDELSADELAELRGELAGNPELREIFAGWMQLREDLSYKLESRIAGREVLVLYAVKQEWGEDILSEDERDEVRRAEPIVNSALESDPFLGDVLSRIRSDMSLFDSVWEEAGERVALEDRVPVKRSQLRLVGDSTLRWAWRVAAVFILGAFLALLLMLYQRDAALETIVTGPGEAVMIELADGSTVRLMENSTLSYIPVGAETGLDRTARISGRGYFAVASSERSFVVETSNARIDVRGTDFGLVAAPTETSVTLVSGSILFASRAAPENPVALTPGQKSEVVGANRPSPPEEVDLTEELVWTGLFIYQAQDLATIAQSLSDHYRVDIVVAPQLRDELITGTFEQELNVRDVLETLAATTGAEVVEVSPTHFRVE